MFCLFSEAPTCAATAEPWPDQWEVESRLDKGLAGVEKVFCSLASRIKDMRVRVSERGGQPLLIYHCPS